MSHSENTLYDYIIIGSGFGGSVCAHRLTQKGYRVAVLEAGKRFQQENDFPKSNWDVNKYLWAPLFKCLGLQQITLLNGLMALHGTGVGGGSLVYAATLVKPKDNIFATDDWPQSVSWKQELAPHYATAKKMLGAQTAPRLFESDYLLKKLETELGTSKTFAPVESGIYFGRPGQSAPDPYFAGDGPERVGCRFCGSCIIGCRHNSKNSLDKNYLYLAEKFGMQLFPETNVDIIRRNIAGHYSIGTQRTGSWFKKDTKEFQAKKVIVAAGVIGTLKLLLRNRDQHKTLHASSMLGRTVRTNGESLLGTTSFDSHRKLSQGLAIGASIHVDANTSIETVRYPEGSGALSPLAVPLTGKGGPVVRPLKMLLNLVVNLPQLIQSRTKGWAKNTVILLVMRSDNKKQRLKMGRSLLNFGRRGLVRCSESDKVPSYMEIAQRSAKILAKEVNGFAQNILPEVLLGAPATAHVLGGACIGADESKGVIDSNHQVFGQEGLFVCDGSSIPGNLGVNPSLTITAMAERFCSQIPAKVDT